MDQILLVNFLRNEINPNIKWYKVAEAFLNNTIDIEKFLTIVKRYAWIDKDIGIVDKFNEHLKYYTELLMSKNVTNMKIGILYTDLNNYSIYTQNDYKDRLEALEIVLKLRRCEYEVCNNIDEANKKDCIIPLTSFAIDCNELERLDKNKLFYIGNNNYTIINKKSETMSYLFDVFHITLNYIYDNDSKKYNYNYMTIY